MTRDDIIRMAREAGISGPAPARQGFKMYANPQRLERFAALVAEAEREACAKECDKVERRKWELLMNGGGGKGIGARDCALTIRARGTT